MNAGMYTSPETDGDLDCIDRLLASEERLSWWLASIRMAQGREQLAARIQEEADPVRRRAMFDAWGQELCV